MAEVVGHGQILPAPTVGQAVADEVNAPDFVVGACQLQRRGLGAGSLLLLRLRTTRLAALYKRSTRLRFAPRQSARTRSWVRREPKRHRVCAISMILSLTRVHIGSAPGGWR